MSTGNSRRRLLVAGLVAGLAIGAAVGATSLTGASSEGPPGAPPVVLHVARVLADPGVDLELVAGLACPAGPLQACAVDSAVAHVLSGGSTGWTDVEGMPEGRGFRFVVPGASVAEDGLSYWLEFAIERWRARDVPGGRRLLGVPRRDNGGAARGGVAGWLRLRGAPCRRRRRSPTAVRR